MDDYLLPSVTASTPQVGDGYRSSEKMFEREAYGDFVQRSAKGLLVVPDGPMSLLCGSGFGDLRPDLFGKVRQGQARFGMPTEQVYDDVLASRAIQRRTFACRWYFWFVRRTKYLVVMLRLLWILGFVIPRISRKLRKSSANAMLATPPSRCEIGRMSTPPRASIVVLSFDRLSYLRNTIAAFLETVDDPRHELIVVDNGSQDGSVHYLRDCHKRGIISKLILLPDNQGISAGYNHGFAARDENSEYVMKLDSDIEILSPNWLAEAIGFLSKNPDVGFVALNQVNHPMLRLLPLLRRGEWELMDFAGWTVGSAMIIPTRVMEEIGFYIEHPQLHYTPDDIDYYVRASRKGYRCFFLRNLLVFHQWYLDHSLYREYRRAKPAGESSQLAIRLAGEYNRGTRPLTVHYEKYRRLS